MIAQLARCDNCGKPSRDRHDVGRSAGRTQHVCEPCLHRIARGVASVERAVRDWEKAA
jgi:hypothetical protein